MNSYVRNAGDKLAQQGYENIVRQKDDYDAFSESSPLSFDDARTFMKDLHLNDLKVIVAYGPASITMGVGDTIQYKLMGYNQKRTRPMLTPDENGYDLTVQAEWLLDPVGSNVVTVVNGLVTGANAGSVDIYAKVGDFETAKISITVA